MAKAFRLMRDPPNNKLDVKRFAANRFTKPPDGLQIKFISVRPKPEHLAPLCEFAKCVVNLILPARTWIVTGVYHQLNNAGAKISSATKKQYMKDIRPA
jgi:hypothetical protein